MYLVKLKRARLKLLTESAFLIYLFTGSKNIGLQQQQLRSYDFKLKFGDEINFLGARIVC